MNREIKFRGKRIDNGELVYGDSLNARSSFIIGAFELDSADGENTDLYATEWYKVDPETVGQFTGLTDKNGVEVFEGDILKCWGGVGMDGELRREYIYPLPVEYNPIDCKFSAVDKANKLQFTIIGRFEAVEVIGNVYDNPELLKGDANDNE